MQYVVAFVLLFAISVGSFAALWQQLKSVRQYDKEALLNAQRVTASRMLHTYLFELVCSDPLFLLAIFSHSFDGIVFLCVQLAGPMSMTEQEIRSSVPDVISTFTQAHHDLVYGNSDGIDSACMRGDASRDHLFDALPCRLPASFFSSSAAYQDFMFGNACNYIPCDNDTQSIGQWGALPTLVSSAHSLCVNWCCFAQVFTAPY